MSVIHEVLGSLRIVKAFGREDYERERFVNRSTQAIKGQLRMAWTGAIFYFIVGMLFATGTALFIYLGAAQESVAALRNLMDMVGMFCGLRGLVGIFVI